MKYKVVSIALIDNNELNGSCEQSKSYINIQISPAQPLFEDKSIKIFDNQPLFFELKRLFSDIQPNENGENELVVKELMFPDYIRIIKGLVTITVNLEDTYYELYGSNILNKGVIVHHKGDVICDKGGTPINHTSIPVFILKNRLQENSNEFMYPIGTPEEVKNVRLKQKYKLAEQQK